jgi:transketolase
MNRITDPRKAFEQKLVDLGKQNTKILAVSCDSASGGALGAFFRTFPDRSIEVGISEQNGVSICAALAKQDFIPVLVIINPFLTMRAYEQVRDDIGYMNTNVKIVGSGGGLAYSTLGSSHMAIEDIALMRTIPNLTIFAPGDADEVAFYLEEAIKINGPVYIRMPRQSRPFPKPAEDRRMRTGHAEVMVSGEDVSIFTYGPSVDEAMKASKILRDNGISASVVNFTTIKPLDKNTIIEYAKKSKRVITLEEHIFTGGLGSAVAEVMAENVIGVPVNAFCVPEGSTNTGPYHELLKYYGLSGDKVAERIINLLKNGGEK